MDISQFLNSEVFGFIILPALIFLIRVIDVSIGTLRIVFISRDIRLAPALLGFFEILIWLFAIGQIMRNLNSPVHYIAYAAGFGMGTFVGVTIERKFSYGNRIIQVITTKGAENLIRILKESGYNLTSIDGKGSLGPVKLIFTVIKRNQAEQVLELIRQFNPKAFYTIEDVKFARDAHLYPSPDRAGELSAIARMFQKRK